MDLLDVFAKFTLDVSGYLKGLFQAENASKGVEIAIENAVDTVDMLSNAFDQASGSSSSSSQSIVQSSDDIANSFETQQNRLQFLAVAYDEAVENVNKIADAFNQSATESGLTSQSTKELASALDKAQKEADKAASNLEKYKSSIGVAATENNNLVRSNENASKSINDVNNALSTEENAIQANSAAVAQSGLTISEYFSVLREGVTEIGSRISDIPNQLSGFAGKSVSALTANSNQLKVLKNEYKEAADKVKELKIELSASVSSTGKASDETKELAKQLKEAESAASSAKKELKDFNDKTDKTAQVFKTIGEAAKVGASAVAAIGTAVAAAGTAMVKAASDTAAYADNIDKASQKLGVSAEFYQEWEAVLQHSGTSMSSMTSTFRTLANAAQDMSEDQQAAFEKLGISIEDVASLSTEDLFEQVISGLQKMESSTERTAIATDLLGRGAMEMGALLNTSADDTQKMIDTVHNLGGVMSDEAIKSGAAFRDSLQDLKTALSGVKNNISTEFLPSMIEVMDGLAAVFSGDDSGVEKAAEGVQDFIDKLSEQLPKVTEFGSQLLLSLLEGVENNLGGISKVTVDIIGNFVNGIITVAPSLIDGAVAIIDQLLDFLNENAYVIANGAVSIIISLVNGISGLLPRLIPAAVQIILQIVKAITDNASALVTAAFQIIASLGTGLIDAIPNILYVPAAICISLADSLVNYDWTSAAEGMMNSLIDALDNAQKKVQVWLDNTFSGGELYGGDIANVESSDFVKNLRSGTDIMISEMEKAQDDIQEHYNAGKEAIATGQDELNNALQDNFDRFQDQYKDFSGITDDMINDLNFDIAAVTTKSGDYVVSATKQTGEKQKSVLVQNMEALERLYKQRKITEEQYQKARLDYLEKHRDEESDEWTKYYDSVQTYYEKLAETEKKAADKAAEEQRKAAEKAAQEREKNFRTILDAYSKQVEQLQNKISSLADKLTGAYKDFYNFETDEDGNITGAYASDKMTQAGDRLQKYYDELIKFQERGVGSDMIAQLSDFSQEEGLATLEYWNSLTDEEIKNLQAKYDRVTQLSNKVGELIYSDEAKSTAEAFADKIGDAVENDDQFRAIGELMLSGIINGLNNGEFDITEAANRIYGAFDGYFQNGGGVTAGSAAMPTYTAPVTAYAASDTGNSAAQNNSSAGSPILADNEFGITINIEEFNNYTNDDIDTLADKILNAIQNKIIRRKAAFL